MAETVSKIDDKVRTVFVTCGTQEPFDRLIEIIDRIAVDKTIKFIVQAIHGKYQPLNFELREYLEPKEYDEIFSNSDIIISHAGVGTILKAIEEGKRLIIFPRKLSLKEHRTNHQEETARHIPDLGFIKKADDHESLVMILSDPNFIFEEVKPFKPDFSLITNYIRQFLGE